MDKLRVQNVTKSFRISEKQKKALGISETKKLAVNDVSFQAYSGEIFGLLGTNGAGKTTTMRMISTLIKPDSGSIWLGDVNVIENPEAARENLAFLTTDLKLDGKSTANDMFDFFSALHHIPREKLKDRKNELFHRFGVDKFADTRINKLSQGMQQKVSLAISVIHNPHYVVFDEPTNGLDILAAREVREFILQLKGAGKCVIVSTHIFDFVEKICDRAALIIDGKIAACDTLEKIMQGRSLEDAFYDTYMETKGGTLNENE